MKYRSFKVETDFPPLLDTLVSSRSEALIAYKVQELFTFGYDVPGRKKTGRPGADEGKPTVSATVTSSSPESSSVQIADALKPDKSGIVLTDHRLAVLKLVPADPGLKEPSLMDDFKGLGRALMGREDRPPYPMACQVVLEMPAHAISYEGVHKEKPKHCRKADYHRIAFPDGSVLGFLAE